VDSGRFESRFEVREHRLAVASFPLVCSGAEKTGVQTFKYAEAMNFQLDEAWTLEKIWRRYDDAELRLSAPLSERMLQLAHLQQGHRVFDLATGRGEPAIRAAKHVGPSGLVVGLDNSAAMLHFARERATLEGVHNLKLLAASADALHQHGTPMFDAVLCRWGLMYFENPVQALALARNFMRPQARLVAALWAEPERVPYFSLPRKALENYREIPEIDRSQPGTFRYADASVIERDFTAAGFVLEQVEELQVDVMEATDAPALVTWACAFGLKRLLQGLPESTRQRWAHDFVELAAPFCRREGYRLGGITRIVVATLKR
jgi:ubiquinone/menaquinone biosynthesis C-methylase UbiE